MWALIIVVLVLVIALPAVGATIYFNLYNRLVALKNDVDNAFSTIDVMLKKRTDLIPNLVAVAKTYMESEQATLTQIAELRSQARSGQLSSQERLQVENKISRAIGNFMIAVEAYPDLKANTQFMQLQRALNEVEEQISAARRFYNSAVTEYNTSIEMFPTILIATQLRYTPRTLFEAAEEDRRNVDVRALLQ